MTWVRRKEAGHACHRPPANQGRLGDLWRCDECRALWRAGRACGYCDEYGTQPHGGQHAVGLTWRPATLWQRLRHRRAEGVTGKG